MSNQRNRRLAALTIALLAGTAIAAFVVAGTRLPRLLSGTGASAEPAELASVLLPAPSPLKAFSLRADDGSPFDLGRLRGRWTMMFFGYTSCPDICPTTLAMLRDVADRLAPDATVQYVFVTVDPSRDDLETVGEYVDFFHPEFIGVSGKPAAIESLMKQLNVMARRYGEDPGPYTISHTSSIMLVDPQGRLVGTFSPPHKPGRIAEQFGILRDYIEEHT